MKRVLLTGAGGFIGRPALEALRARGCEIVTLGRKDANLLDPAAAARVVAEARASHLLHFAWYVEHGKFWSAPENRAWVDASLNVLQAFARAGGQRAVMAGTCAEYDWNHGPCDERSTPIAPATLYGQCKHEAHMRAQAFSEQHGLSFAWGRIFHLYGPREAPKRLVASVIRAILAGHDAPMTHGAQRRDVLHVDDVAEGFVALLASPAQGPVNIARGESITLAELAGEAARQLGAPERLKLGAIAAPPDDPPAIEARADRLRREAGFRPRYDLRSGIAQTIAWWRAQPPIPPQGSAP